MRSPDFYLSLQVLNRWSELSSKEQRRSLSRTVVAGNPVLLNVKKLFCVNIIVILLSFVFQDASMKYK